MMLSKDGTSIIGKIGFLLPLLILFIATDAAACPEHRSGATLRTKAVKIRNGGSVQTTVIGYRAPATYRLCGNTLRDTRNVAYVRSGGYRTADSARYVAVRRRAPMYIQDSGTRYVAVRNVDRSPRYVAIRNADYAPRYVAVRRSAPVHFEDSNVRYVAVRNDDRYYSPSRTRTLVHGIDIDAAPRYVAARRAPIYMDNDDREYVPVRNVDRYNSGFPREIEEVDLNDEPLVERRHVVEYSDAEFTDDDNDGTMISASQAENACPLQTSPMVETRMVSYVEDDDIDDYAFLRVRTAAPAVASYAPASYAPVYDDDVVDVEENDVAYITPSNSMSTVSYVPVDDDVGEVDDGDVMYVAANNIEEPCRVIARTCSDNIGTDEISYVPVDDSHMQTVSYVPVEEVENVSYVPADEVETVSYAPASKLIYSDAADIDADACPMMVSSVDDDAIEVANDSEVSLIEDRDADYIAGISTTGGIASSVGYRDGFADGAEAAADLDTYHPENSGDYKKATNGYEDSYGDKDLYKESYRSAYLTGYRAGFDSIETNADVG